MAQHRRYDIDWIRVVAIGLLIVYHVAIVFQPWGLMVGFITNKESWPSLWWPMTMLNVWRIPILFFVAGMGLFFSFQNRNWQQLLIERAMRIGVPLVFGSLVLAPLYLFFLQSYYDWPVHYKPQMAHLWFLGNILIYVLCTLPLSMLLKTQTDHVTTVWIRQVFKRPVVLLLITGGFIIETILVRPMVYEMYAMTWHGFIMGWLAFLVGYLMAYTGTTFWNMLIKYKWMYLFLSILLFVLRSSNTIKWPHHINLPIESCMWIFTVLSFAHQYLNQPHKLLTYFARAVYPVYIVHMVFLGLSSILILPLNIHAQLKFLLVLVGTTLGSLLCYEFLVKRIKLFRILFGLFKDQP